MNPEEINISSKVFGKIKSKIEAKPQPSSTPEEKEPPVEVSHIPHKSTLPWENDKDFANALIKDNPSESTLKSYAKILGIDYNPHFETFYNEATVRFNQIFY